MKIQNALVSNILDRSQRYIAHVTTVTLSWRVQNIVVIGRVYFTLECFEFSSNFEFDRNMLSGTGTSPMSWQSPTVYTMICCNVYMYHVSSCISVGNKFTTTTTTNRIYTILFTTPLESILSSSPDIIYIQDRYLKAKWSMECYSSAICKTDAELG